MSANPSATDTSYDEVPYTAHVFPQTHPDRMAVIARLFSHGAPEPRKARILELGCGIGANLINIAAMLPESECLGVDLSARQIDMGQSLANEAGVANVTLRQADLNTWRPEGKWDYIICHGVFSWVPEAVRERILALIRRALSADGVAYVSYNTLPGWHMRGMVRDMMRYHAQTHTEPTMKVQQSRALLKFLAEAAPSGTPYGSLLQQELKGLARQPDSYLFHEHLEQENTAFYFHDFAARAGRHALQYLGEADFNSMVPRNFGPKVAETLKRVGRNIVMQEQYMDFLRNRTFRQTLLLHGDRRLERNIPGEVLYPLCVVSGLQRKTGQEAAEPATFVGANGVTVSPRREGTVRALDALAKAAPKAHAFEDLVRLGLDGATPADADRAAMAQELMQLFSAGLLELWQQPPVFERRPGERPVAWALARRQAAAAPRGAALSVASARHQNIAVDAMARELLPVLDGQHDHAALQAHLERCCAEGHLVLRQNDSVLDTAGARAPHLENGVRQVLERFATSGLLVS